MSDGTPALNSTIARKYLMGATGLFLVFFATLHLAGNFALLLPDGGESFNAYGALLHSLGGLFYAGEIGLFAIIILHAGMGTKVTRENSVARPSRYAVTANAGGPSQKTVASANMIKTGVVLFAFLVVHLKTIRFGKHWVVGDSKALAGTDFAAQTPEMLDLAGLTVTLFQNPLYTAFYTVCMLVLGAHLRHGFWSAFQSLGLNHPRFNKPIQMVGKLLAVALAVGFLVLPIWMMLDPLDLYGEMVR